MKLILDEALGKTNPLKYSFGFNNLYDYYYFFVTMVLWFFDYSTVHLP